MVTSNLHQSRPTQPSTQGSFKQPPAKLNGATKLMQAAMAANNNGQYVDSNPAKNSVNLNQNPY